MARVLRYIRDHWHGTLSLKRSFWINFVLIYWLLYFSETLLFPPFVTGEWTVIILVSGFVILTRLVIYPWQVIGVIRACDRFMLENTDRTWSNAALVIVVLSLVHVLVASFTSYHKIQKYRYSLNPANKQTIKPLYILSVSVDGKTLSVNGPLQVGITRNVSSLLEQSTGVKRVLLSSQGGRIYEGRGLARLIREGGLETVVLDTCSSACTTAFIAGVQRLIGPRARIGFHEYKSYVVYPKIDVKEEQAKDTALFRAQGVDPEFVRRAFDHPAESMWWPSHQELLTAKVVTGRWAGKAPSFTESP